LYNSKVVAITTNEEKLLNALIIKELIGDVDIISTSRYYEDMSSSDLISIITNRQTVAKRPTYSQLHDTEIHLSVEVDALTTGCRFSQMSNS